MRTLKLHETKFFSRIFFIGNFFELQREKKPKMTKGNLFVTLPRFLTYVLTFTPQM